MRYVKYTRNNHMFTYLVLHFYLVKKYKLILSSEIFAKTMLRTIVCDKLNYFNNNYV